MRIGHKMEGEFRIVSDCFGGFQDRDQRFMWIFVHLYTHVTLMK